MGNGAERRNLTSEAGFAGRLVGREVDDDQADDQVCQSDKRRREHSVHRLSPRLRINPMVVAVKLIARLKTSIPGPIG